jgi:hypothetical protein
MRTYFIPRTRDGFFARLFDGLGLYQVVDFFSVATPYGRVRHGALWSVVVHVLVLVIMALLFARKAILPEPPLPMIVSLAVPGRAEPTAPQVSPEPPQEAALPPPPAHRAGAIHPVAPPPRSLVTSQAPAPLTAPPPLAQPSAPSNNDMMALVSAHRAQRDAEAELEHSIEAQENTSETAEQRANRLARANVAASLRPPQGGHGMFEVRSVGLHDAELIFDGWNNDFHHDARQDIQVAQGSEPSLELAVVRKMIQIIHTRTQTDFTWESHRLGRIVALSARPEDNSGLEDFLMLEFRDDFLPGRSKPNR